MTPEQFSSRFSLFELAEPDSRYEGIYTPNAKSKVAAVLVPIVSRHNGLHLLFTQRAAHMRHHPGQISFPGGRVEPDDESLAAAALRETHEEIGLPPEEVLPLGWLPSLHTISNYSIHPLVGFINPNIQLTLSPDEVAASFEVPLSHFTNRTNHTTMRPSRNGRSQTVHFMPYEDKLIWGATASILDKLVRHLE